MLQNMVAAEELTLVKEKQKPTIVLKDVRITSSNLNCVLQSLLWHTKSINYLFLIIGRKPETTTRWVDTRTTASTHEPVGWGAWGGGYRRLSMATAPPSI